MGTRQRNQEISQARADAVRNYLVRHGIAPSRLAAKGLGETKFIGDNHTAKGRAANRRIEFHISSQ